MNQPFHPSGDYAKNRGSEFYGPLSYPCSICIFPSVFVAVGKMQRAFLGECGKARVIQNDQKFSMKCGIQPGCCFSGIVAELSIHMSPAVVDQRLGYCTAEHGGCSSHVAGAACLEEAAKPHALGFGSCKGAQIDLGPSTMVHLSASMLPLHVKAQI